MGTIKNDSRPDKQTLVGIIKEYKIQYQTKRKYIYFIAEKPLKN